MTDAQFQRASHQYDPPTPDDFRDWQLQRQLDWSVDNYLPGQLQWLENWAQALDHDPQLPVLVTRFEEFREDQTAFFRNIAGFFGIAELRVPTSSEQDASAMRNFRSGQLDEWRQVLTRDQLRPYEARLAPLAERFGWSM
jgi:hypothetical protein